eukprot:1161225-Pelagomonas_calceolata.AAC.30
MRRACLPLGWGSGRSPAEHSLRAHVRTDSPISNSAACELATHSLVFNKPDGHLHSIPAKF